MGLTIISSDNKVDLFSAPYSSFGDFRIALAEYIGLIKYKHGIYCRGNWRGNPNEAVEEVKQTTPELANFFLHSDCEGSLSVAECTTIYKELLKVNPNDEFMNGIDTHFDKHFRQFMIGLKYCVDNNMEAVFL